eukprot:TRINITY_DN21311_c0_g1_i1.p1 TRINITY_DN21311_c0_g1~~TRINITY_DN21311_c0_g1_i1.p1  ORF type:complete len:468 (+),score=73.78 TRINITY_DN21311_c0_g1_i1:60-1463(+)
MASEHYYRPTHWPSIIFMLLEQPFALLLLIPTITALFLTLLLGQGILFFLACFFATPLAGIGIPVVTLWKASWQGQDGSSDWHEYCNVNDARFLKKWKGKKIPINIFYEAYMKQKLDVKGDFLEFFMRRHQLFRFSFTFEHFWFYVATFLKQNLGHSLRQDADEIRPVYNRGNDFYEFFLGKYMKYSSGIYRDVNENLDDAQERMLDLVCQQTQMKPGMKHFDFGCGWGSLVIRAAEKFGTDSRGITLAPEQADYVRSKAEEHGVADKVHIDVMDYRHVDTSQKYDVITCLEMSEHVGIRNYQKFMQQVKAMLKEDGVFYLQIAGLRRAWQYEDLVWGLFMGKYIFPGADASCPLAFPVSQLERAGFEVHRVENTGVHYALTIKAWYYNWIGNQDAIVAKYGEWWYRLWVVFLAWSTCIAFQGSSTVFMITATKNHRLDARSVAPGNDTNIDRAEKWIGPNPIGLQQ